MKYKVRGNRSMPVYEYADRHDTIVDGFFYEMPISNNHLTCKINEVRLTYLRQPGISLVKGMDQRVLE